MELQDEDIFESNLTNIQIAALKTNSLVGSLIILSFDVIYLTYF